MTRHGSAGSLDAPRIRVPAHRVGGSRPRRTLTALTSTVERTAAVTAPTATSGHSHTSSTDDRRSWGRPVHDGFPQKGGT